MKNILLISFLFLSTIFVFAQDTTLQVPKNGEVLLKFVITDWDLIPESDAKVIITNTNNTYKNEGVSDIDGLLNVIAPSGDTYNVAIYKFDTVFNFNGITAPAEEVGYEFDITLKIKLVTEEYISIQALNVHFASNEFALDASDKKELDFLVEQLKKVPNRKIEIAAHTDNVGDEQSNMRLSQKRANSVKSYLVLKGISEKRIVSKGYGEAKPIQTNDTAEGKAANRRVECRVISE